jgi:heme-degrading monooxygenase HmoA
MSVLVRLSASGMTTDMYDKASEQLTPLVLSAPGFVAHVAFEGDGEFHVSEIWESRDDFQNWFDNNVKPNVPGVEIDVVREVHNVIIKK